MVVVASDPRVHMARKKGICKSEKKKGVEIFHNDKMISSVSELTVLLMVTTDGLLSQCTHMKH